MANYQYMMSADDVARELNCSKSHAYKLVKSMNEELDISQWLEEFQERIGRKRCMATNYQ
ncbi:MAG: DNA-binding protein [Lachnospiraceae bacterium]